MSGAVRRNPQRKATDEQILSAYAEHGTIWKAAASLGMCGQSVHERLQRLGAVLKNRPFSEAEDEILRQEYQRHADAGTAGELAERMGRTRHFICRRARELGLTTRNRKRPYLAEVSSKFFTNWHQNNPHPKGMLGKKHAANTVDEMKVSRAARWAAMTEDDRDSYLLKMLKGRAAAGSLVSPRPQATWKAGWREIGGKRSYFRSAWEANYARYLEWLKDNRQIAEWEHEPETFWFDGIKRGTCSYLPDFRVTELNGTVIYHEVKGWMDDRSKTKLNRMRIYHPTVRLLVIDGKAYRRLADQLSRLVPGWE